MKQKASRVMTILQRHHISCNHTPVFTSKIKKCHLCDFVLMQLLVKSV